MRTQPRVLQLFAHRREERRAIAFEDIARELDVTDQAAVDTLARLWRQRLIAPLAPRRHGYSWRPEPGERVRDLRFRLTARGQERLGWWAAKRRAKTTWWGV